MIADPRWNEGVAFGLTQLSALAVGSFMKVRQYFIKQAGQVGKSLIIVCFAFQDDMMGFLAAVDVGYFALRFGPGHLFVGQEVVNQPLYECFRAIGYILHRSKYSVAFENRNDFVIGLVPVEHAQAADRDGFEQQVAVGNGFLGKDTYVQRVMVTLQRGSPGLFCRESCHPVPQ